MTTKHAVWSAGDIAHVELEHAWHQPDGVRCDAAVGAWAAAVGAIDRRAGGFSVSAQYTGK